MWDPFASKAAIFKGFQENHVGPLADSLFFQVFLYHFYRFLGSFF